MFCFLMRTNVVDLWKKRNSTRHRAKVLRKVYEVSQSILHDKKSWNVPSAILTLELLYHSWMFNNFYRSFRALQNQTAFYNVQSKTENRYFLFSIILLLTYFWFCAIHQPHGRTVRNHSELFLHWRKLAVRYLPTESGEPHVICINAPK